MTQRVLPSIDVVIPVHNRIELTESCLSHLAAQTVPHQVLVVDNGSTDGTSDRLRDSWPEVSLHHTDQPLGFAKACNWGAALGSNEVIVLLNNDVDCRPDFLERLIAPFSADDSIGAVASTMLRLDERAIDSVGLFADVTLAGFQRLDGQPPGRAHDPTPLLASPAGAAAAFRPPLGMRSAAWMRPSRPTWRTLIWACACALPAGEWSRRLMPSEFTEVRRRTGVGPHPSAACSALDAATSCDATGCFTPDMPHGHS